MRSLFLPLLLLATPAAAQSPFDGTWKADLSSLSIAAPPDRYLLKDGVLTCESCKPAPVAVRADGAFHPVAGKDYYDAMAVTVVDANTIRRELRFKGKVIGGGTQTVSADGNTLTTRFANTNNAAGIEEATSIVTTRVGARPKGLHPISGSWKAAAPASSSDSAMQMTLRVADGTLHLTSPRNETLVAKIGGDYAPVVGDPGGTRTKVAMAGPRTLAMTEMRGGKVVGTSTYTVSPDGTTINGAWKDPVDSASGTFVARKQ